MNSTAISSPATPQDKTLKEIALNLNIATIYIKLSQALNLKKSTWPNALQTSENFNKNFQFTDVSSGILSAKKLCWMVESFVYSKVEEKLKNQINMMHEFYFCQRNQGVLLDNIISEVNFLERGESSSCSSSSSFRVNEYDEVQNQQQIMMNMLNDWCDNFKRSNIRDYASGMEEQEQTEHEIHITLSSKNSNYKILPKLDFLLRELPNCPSTNLYPTLNNILSTWPINLIISESDELILKGLILKLIQMKNKSKPSMKFISR